MSNTVSAGLAIAASAYAVVVHARLFSHLPKHRPELWEELARPGWTNATPTSMARLFRFAWSTGASRHSDLALTNLAVHYRRVTVVYLFAALLLLASWS
jgi:hypothetical protein